MRDDYAPFFAFAHASGLRLRECLLRWSEVDWGTKRITRPGKGEKLVTVQITDTAAQLRAPAPEHGELPQDGTTEHLGAPKHPKRQAGPEDRLALARCWRTPLLADPVSCVLPPIGPP
jgi:hypothetical protein